VHTIADRRHASPNKIWLAIDYLRIGEHVCMIADQELNDRSTRPAAIMPFPLQQLDLLEPWTRKTRGVVLRERWC
jgi:hypothetical protein